MNIAEIEGAFERAERVLDEYQGLKGTGFWRAVGALRRDRALAERYADRAGDIDRRAFEAGVPVHVPLGIGLSLLLAKTGFGVIAYVLALRAAGHESPSGMLTSLPSIDAYRWPGFVPIAFLAGFAAILVGSHSLAHWVVGRAVGIRFTHVFLGGPPPPRPGVKTDYASYLRASPRSRALMHASGAVVTKIVPFALIPAAMPMYRDGHWPWLVWILLAFGLLQIVTDVLFSTKTSDWKKVRRELRASTAS